MSEEEKDKILESIEGKDALQSNKSEYILSFRIKEFDSDKEYFQFIKNVERMIRTSPEYRLWVNYIKDVLGNNYCLISKEISQEVSIEIHHVITLFDLVMIVVDTRIMNNKAFSSFDISEEVMSLHFKNVVAYVPLAKTLHEKVHSGALKIPTSMIFGNWKRLTSDEFGYFVNDDIKKKIELIKNVSITDIQITWSKDFYPGVVERLEHNNENLVLGGINGDSTNRTSIENISIKQNKTDIF